MLVFSRTTAQVVGTGTKMEDIIAPHGLTAAGVIIVEAPDVEAGIASGRYAGARFVDGTVEAIESPPREPPTPQPTLEQRLAEALERIAVLEQAQATLGAEVSKVTALGAMSQPIE